MPRTQRLLRSRGIVHTLTALGLSALVLAGCRDDAPAHSVGDGDSRDTSIGGTGQTAAPAPGDASSPSAASPGTSGSTWTGATTDARARQERLDVVNTLTEFLATIDTGSAASLQSMLSARSRELLVALHADDEILPIAREALGSLEHREVRVLGGTVDSVALMVTANRRESDSLVQERLILSVLRENGAWKIMYPGAQRVDEHVGP